MQVFLIVYVIVVIFISILIIASVLLQEDKSGGGISILGGSSQSFFGVSSGSILSKFTSILLAIFFISAVIISILCARFTNELIITKSDISKTEFSEYEAKKTIVDTKTDFVDKQETED